MKYKTFKQLVKLISEIKNEQQMNEVCYQIDMSFQNEKITFQDNEMLYKIISMLK
jgi:hypothetical protein